MLQYPKAKPTEAELSDGLLTKTAKKTELLSRSNRLMIIRLTQHCVDI